MLEIKLSKQAKKFLSTLPVKQATQIAQKILLLWQENTTILSQELKWYTPYRRIKSWEYRVVYIQEDQVISISLIGKRNDDEIYKMVGRFLK